MHFDLHLRASMRNAAAHVELLIGRSNVSTTFLSVVVSTYLLALSPLAHAACSPALTEQLVSAERIVDSLRPDKAGQMRVFASDGSEYTAGEALWMKAQLRGVLRACGQGDEAFAAATLRGVTDLLNAHHKA